MKGDIRARREGWELETDDVNLRAEVRMDCEGLLELIRAVGSAQAAHAIIMKVFRGILKRFVR